MSVEIFGATRARTGGTGTGNLFAAIVLSFLLGAAFLVALVYRAGPWDIVGMTRLLDPPVTRATIGDITCDSDGRIDDFVGCAGLRKTLPLPTLNVEEPFHIGVFLVGAYQDTLGDFHNLFGAANEAAVIVDESGGMLIPHQYRGTTVAEALEVFGYPHQLIRARFDERHGGDDSIEATRYRDCFMRIVSSGTYLKR